MQRISRRSVDEALLDLVVQPVVNFSPYIYLAAQCCQTFRSNGSSNDPSPAASALDGLVRAWAPPIGKVLAGACTRAALLSYLGMGQATYRILWPQKKKKKVGD